MFMFILIEQNKVNLFVQKACKPHFYLYIRLKQPTKEAENDEKCIRSKTT